MKSLKYMIPKIIFRYSPLYDSNYRDSDKIKERLKEKGLTYPSTKEIFNEIEKIKPLWSGIESDALKSISEITGLNWKEKDIVCYVIGFGRSFSDPLTIKIHETPELFIDTLVHELIHHMQVQNNEQSKKWYSYLDKNYSNETSLTKNHIIVHAVHKKIYLTLFDKKRLETDIKDSGLSKDYARSWEIVEKEGYENLIKKFKQLTK